jgi:cytochrome c
MAVLRTTVLSPATADIVSNVSYGTRTSSEGQATRATAVTAMRNGHIGFRALDLTGVRQLRLATTTGGGMGAAGGVIEVRVGSPQGPLIGQGTVTPAPPRGRGAGAVGAAVPAATISVQDVTAPGLAIDLTPTTGVQDLYLVFRNDRATETQPLLAISAVRFVF